jgi:hypothetical protein
VGVGSNHPDPVAPVRSPNVLRSQHHPSRIVPERGKVTEDDGKSSTNKQWAVFHENVSRSNLADNSRHLSPQSAALSIDAETASGAANVLARESSRNHVNSSSPRSPVKGSHVIPNWERRKCAVVLTGHEYACGVGVELDSANGSPSEQDAAEYASTSARE